MGFGGSRTYNHYRNQPTEEDMRRQAEKEAEEAAAAAAAVSLENKEDLWNMGNQVFGAGDREAPTADKTQLGAAANIDQQQQAQFRQRQMDLANTLALQASGQGPSVAAQQFKNAAATNMAQQRAMAAGARGGNVALASRQAAQNTSRFNQQAAGGAATARIQEQLAAQQALGGVLNQGRTSDIGLATSQAGFDQQRMLQQGMMDQDVNLANLKAQLAQTGMNDAMQMNALAQMTGMDIAELQARLTQYGIDAEQPGWWDSWGKDLLGVAGTIGAAAAASDRNLKENIKPGDRRLDALLAQLVPYEYDYKDPEKFGRGKQIGVMAQDLEKSELGSEMVIDTPEGKMVNYGKGLGTIVAALAHLNRKVDSLKKG